MSMNFSEFRKRLGAEPRSEDAELLAARDSAPEFRAEYDRAATFEERLERAAALDEPAGLVDELLLVPEKGSGHAARSFPMALAVAASLVLAIGAAGLLWQMKHSWDTVEDYVMDHYREDGAGSLAAAASVSPEEVQSILAAFDVEATPELAGIVGLIKYCPTPDGKGVHMILNTVDGPLTVFYLPRTAVTDGEWMTFDDVSAVLVELESGSAVIIGPEERGLENYYAVIQDAILPRAERS
jgi:hypothetical protein